MEYKWNKTSIEASSFNDELKQVLYDETSNKTLERDPSYIKILSFRQFKHDYKFVIKLFKKYNTSIYNLIKNLPRIYPYNITSRYNFPHQNFTPDILMQIETRFIEYLEDKELLELYKKLIEEDKHLINIDMYQEDKEICKLVNGRTISNGIDTFMSYYMKDSIEDLSILTHEFGHMFARCLFKDSESLFNTLLTETESIYMELLMDNFIGKSLEEEELMNMLISNRCLKCIEDIWVLKVKNIAAHLPIYNERLINYFDGNSKVKLTEADSAIILNNDTFNLIKRVLSTLFAFTIYERTLKNIEEGIALYKSLLSSKEKNIEKLMKEHNISFSDLILNFFKYTKQSEELSNSKKR